MWQDPLFILVVVTVLIVAIVLMTGIGVFGRGGEANRKYANKIMRARIVAQAIAILAILLFVWIRRGA